VLILQAIDQRRLHMFENSGIVLEMRTERIDFGLCLCGKVRPSEAVEQQRRPHVTRLVKVGGSNGPEQEPYATDGTATGLSATMLIGILIELHR
jgi:hypothetical protein